MPRVARRTDDPERHRDGRRRPDGAALRHGARRQPPAGHGRRCGRSSARVPRRPGRRRRPSSSATAWRGSWSASIPARSRADAAYPAAATDGAPGSSGVRRDRPDAARWARVLARLPNASWTGGTPAARAIERSSATGRSIDAAIADLLAARTAIADGPPAGGRAGPLRATWTAGRTRRRALGPRHCHLMRDRFTRRRPAFLTGAWDDAMRIAGPGRAAGLGVGL